MLAVFDFSQPETQFILHSLSLESCRTLFFGSFRCRFTCFLECFSIRVFCFFFIFFVLSQSASRNRYSFVLCSLEIEPDSSFSQRLCCRTLVANHLSNLIELRLRTTLSPFQFKSLLVACTCSFASLKAHFTLLDFTLFIEPKPRFDRRFVVIEPKDCKFINRPDQMSSRVKGDLSLSPRLQNDVNRKFLALITFQHTFLPNIFIKRYHFFQIAFTVKPLFLDPLVIFVFVLSSARCQACQLPLD